jgi:hypothetical protein
MRASILAFAVLASAAPLRLPKTAQFDFGTNIPVATFNSVANGDGIARLGQVLIAAAAALGAENNDMSTFQDLSSEISRRRS